MTEKVKVIISNNQNAVKIPAGIRLLVRKTCHATLVLEDFDGSAEISVNIDRSTDVLSFPLGENGVYDVNPDTGAKLLGDIVISMQHAVAQAEEYGHSLQREVAYLTAHSMLHLLGYDHEEGGLQRIKMREKEEAVLTRLGLPRNGSYYPVD